MNEKKHVLYQKNYFEKNYKKTMVPRKSAYIERQVERLIKAGVTRADRIIDVGCGIGTYTIKLNEMGSQIEGLDIAEDLLEQMKRHNQTGRPLPLHCADASNPPEHLLGQYDLAIGFFALHHMFDLAACFRGIKRLLKPNGRLLFLEPNPYNILYYLQILLTPKMTWQGDKGILDMRPSILFPLMEEAGFLNPSVHRSGFFPPFIADLKGAIAVEKALEKIPLWSPLLPFQIFSAKSKT